MAGGLLPDRDPRTEGWFAYDDWPTFFCIIGIYVLTAGVVLPCHMVNRRGFRLVFVVRTYNLALIGINLYFMIRLAGLTYFGGTYNWICQGVGGRRQDLVLVSLLHRYLFVRIFELLDTVFFVLRKQFRHANGRNILHHVVAIFIPWYSVTYGIDGQICLMTLVTTMAHVIVYFYYFLATFPKLKPHLKWKVYLTFVQIGQFAIIVAHMSVPLFLDCGYPWLNSLIVVGVHIYFLVAFRAFFGSTYRSGDKTTRYFLTRKLIDSFRTQPSAQTTGWLLD